MFDTEFVEPVGNAAEPVVSEQLVADLAVGRVVDVIGGRLVIVCGERVAAEVRPVNVLGTSNDKEKFYARSAGPA